MTFSLTILGNGSAMPTVGKHNSAHILNVCEQFYLIDCGEATQIQMRRYGINPLKIRAVFITHLHGDHTFGLPGLISTMNFLKRGTPLHIYGPRPLNEIIDNHIKYYETELGFEIIHTEVDTRKELTIFENSVMTVSTIPLRHRIPCAGYLFAEKEPLRNIHKSVIEENPLSLAQIAALKRGDDIDGLRNEEATYRPYKARMLAYCSDTNYSAKVARIAKGADLIYHDSTYTQAELKLAKQTGHSTAGQAAKVALMAEAGQLLLGHFSSRHKDESIFEQEARVIFPNTIAAREGETISIPLKKWGEKL